MSDREHNSVSIDKPKRPSAGVTALLIGCFVTIYVGIWVAQSTIGANWSGNMNCLLGICVAVPIIIVFGLIRRALFGPPPR